MLDVFPTPYPEEWWSILLPHDAIEAKKEHATGLTGRKGHAADIPLKTREFQ